MEYNRFLGHNKGGKNWFLSPVFTISMNVCNMSAVLACLSTMALTPCWCSATVAALFLELFEACNNRKTKAFFSKQGAPKWATLVRPTFMSPSVQTEGESCLQPQKRRGETCPLFLNCVFISPLTVGSHGLSQRRLLFVWWGESMGILFQSFLEVLCLTWWGLSTLPVAGSSLVPCVHFPASALASVLSALCVDFWMLRVYSVFTPVEVFFLIKLQLLVS